MFIFAPKRKSSCPKPVLWVMIAGSQAAAGRAVPGLEPIRLFLVMCTPSGAKERVMSSASLSDMPLLAGVSHELVEVRGIQIHVAQAGSGPPLLLLHGWPEHWYMWRELIGPLAERYRVICPDMRGFGWSDAPATGYAKEDLASDVLALMDAMSLQRVGLMGHDWGGFIGFLLCLRAPERFDRYLALNIAHPFQQAGTRLLHAWRMLYQVLIAMPWLGTAVLHDRTGFVRRILRGSMPAKRVSWDECGVYATRFNDPARAYASTLLYRTFLCSELGPLLRGRYRGQRLKVKTLLLFGEQDLAIRPSMVRDLPSHGDDAQVVFLPQAGHFIVEDCPDVVLQHALAFFADYVSE